MKCRHGLKIREVWYECPDCAIDNSWTKEEVKQAFKENEERKRKERLEEIKNRPVEPKEGKLGSAIGEILGYIAMGLVVYFMVGFGGCAVRIVTTDWVRNNDLYKPFSSYRHEAVVAFCLITAIGIFRASRVLKK